MIDWRFIAWLSALMAASGVIGTALVDPIAGGAPALLVGLAFTWVSLAFGYHWVRWSAGGNDRSFMVALMGTMVVRVIGVVTLALVVAFASDLNLVVTLLTVVAAHIVFSVFEIAYVKRAGVLE